MRAPPVLERAVSALLLLLSCESLNSGAAAHRRELVPAQRCASGALELGQDASSKGLSVQRRRNR